MDVRPVALSIEQYAEYLQSEAEDLSLGISPQDHHCRCGTTTTALKAVSGADLTGAATGATNGSSAKSPCKFWKTTEGCKRGSSCTFLHETADMKGRCFNCGSSAHLRRECTAKGSTALRVESMVIQVQPKSWPR